MGIILTLVIGGILGWLASLVMRTDAQQGPRLLTLEQPGLGRQCSTGLLQAPRAI